MSWQPYNGDRLINKQDGFVVIKPLTQHEVVPLGCPLCDVLFRTRDDLEAFQNFSCCNHCAQTFAHPRRQAWLDGWRPTKEQIDESMSLRCPQNINVVID